MPSTKSKSLVTIRTTTMVFRTQEHKSGRVLPLSIPHGSRKRQDCNICFVTTTNSDYEISILLIQIPTYSLSIYRSDYSRQDLCSNRILSLPIRASQPSTSPLSSTFVYYFQHYIILTFPCSTPCKANHLLEIFLCTNNLSYANSKMRTPT